LTYIVLLSTVALNVLLVVHALSVLLGLTLGLLLVEPVLALGLGQLVNLCGSEASNKLLSEGVGDGLACASVNDMLQWGCGGVSYPRCAGGPRRP